MSLIEKNILKNLHFYLSAPMPCPYLPDQIERKLFTHMPPDDAAEDTRINAALCQAGFRRSHDILYRPACEACNACIPVRIAVDFFKPSRSLRRVQHNNRDLTITRADAVPSDELFALFAAYQRTRHGDSDMAQMDYNDFSTMLREGRAETCLFIARDPQNLLKACMIADFVGDGFSAVYSFFAPDEPQSSLGSFMILSLIDIAVQQKRPYIYLGYWIAASHKMAYKSRFHPLQKLSATGWQWV